MEANFHFNEFMLCKWPFIVPEKQNLRVTSQKTIEREVAWFAESCDIEDEVVNKQKKIISEILEENEKWQPFGGRCLDGSATNKFEISETFCIITYRLMFWVFFSRTKVLFVNRGACKNHWYDTILSVLHRFF